MLFTNLWFNIVLKQYVGFSKENSPKPYIISIITMILCTHIRTNMYVHVRIYMYIPLVAIKYHYKIESNNIHV